MEHYFIAAATCNIRGIKSLKYLLCFTKAGDGIKTNCSAKSCEKLLILCSQIYITFVYRREQSTC